MIVASSTPVREVRCALAVHDIERYFVDVVSTEDVGGRDKEFPDVYLEALRRLGTDASTTWVFEDAPFGVQTSKRAGFHVVGLMNDHDGRREEDVRPWCDVYVHGYHELSLALINDYADEPEGERRAVLRVLVVDGSPQASSPELVARLAADSDFFFSPFLVADTGRASGGVRDASGGDDDSVSAATREWAEGVASTNIRFPAEKYATDLALALDCVQHEAARRDAAVELTVTCASGGRADHALAVVGLVLGADAVMARIVEDGHEMRIVSPRGQSCWELGPDAVGKTFSVVALAPDTRVTLRGMEWPLESRELPLLVDDLCVSNVVTAPDAKVICESGALAAFVLEG